MANLLIIICFLTLGLLAQRTLRLPEHTPLRLNQLVINVAIPALILLRVPALEFSSDLLFPMLAPWGAVAVSALLVRACARRFAWSPAITGALLMTAALGNTSYLGFPMVKLFYGEQALAFAIIYDQIGSFLALAIYGAIVIAVYSDDGRKPNLAAIAMRIVRFPPFIAMLAALLLPLDTLISAIQPLLHLCAAAMVPLTMFIVGLQLQWHLEPDYRKPLYLGIGIKMLLAPLAITVLTLLFSVKADIASVSMFEAAMPPMVTAGAMAMSAKLAPRLAAAMIGIGMLSASAILPFWYLVSTLLFS